MHLNWSTTGKKIVQVLSQNDHVMAQELKQFEKGPENTEDTNKYLQDLFAAIEAEAAKVKLVFPRDKKKWHASFAGADERRPCRYGTDCTDTLCTRSHPKGFKRNRTEFEHSKGARVRQAREENEKDSEVKEKVAREAEADLRVKSRAAASLRLIPARPSVLPASRRLLTQGQ